MALHCFHCGIEISLAPGQTIGRSDTCDKCNSDLHACLNCRHYDEKAYNNCREPQADRVLDKDRRNFCDLFSPATEARGKASPDKNAAMKKLDDLFK